MQPIIRVLFYGVAAAAALAQTSFEPVCLSEREMDGALGRRLKLTIAKNFMAIDYERDFLRPFRAQRPAEAVLARFGDNAIELGENLHAAVWFARCAADRRVAERKDSLVRGAIEAQAASGYIGVFQEEPQARQIFRNYAVEEASLLILGLIEDFRLFGNRASLESARRLGRYMVENWRYRPKGIRFSSLGLPQGLLALYQATGNREFLRFAADETGGGLFLEPLPLRVWKQDIYEDRPLDYEGARQVTRVLPRGLFPDVRMPTYPVDRVHVYSLLERAIMQMRLNRVEPSVNLMEMAQRILERLTAAQRAGLVVIGTASMREGWHEDQDGRGPLGETCTTVHLLWFFDEWLRQTGDLRFGDLMERVVYNALFAAQSPEGRQIRYFTPFSGERRYFEMDTYCCPGNFRRGMALLPCMAYYSNGRGVAVNLFTQSRATVKLEGGVSVTLDQKTDYPASGDVELAVTPSRTARFPVYVRVPRWCRKPSLAVNGKPWNLAEVRKGGIAIDREWRPADRISLRLPMPWRFVRGMGRQTGRAAFLRGPVVYCLNPGRNPMLGQLRPRDIVLDVRADEAADTGAGFRTAIVSAWKPAESPARPASLKLVLSEFTDPGGEEIYFRVSRPAATEPDELLQPLR